LNVNQNIAGTDVDSNSGNKSAATQRIVIADDDTNLSAIKIAVESLDNAVDGNYLNVNQNIAGTDVDSNSGNKSAATQRIVIADDDTNLSAIKIAVESLDNAVDGNYLNVNQNIAGTDVDSNSGNKSQIDLLEENNTIKDVEWLDNETISDQSLSSVLIRKDIKMYLFMEKIMVQYLLMI
jgi:hypothetical protein